MRKHFFPALIALMLCLPQILLAGVNTLLPKPHVVNVTNGGDFGLNRLVSIVYANGAEQCALLEEIFTTNGCALGENGAEVTVTTAQPASPTHRQE